MENTKQKTTENFKNAISSYLRNYAEKDSVFKDKVIAFKDVKNIDDCIKYILNTVQKSGVQGFADDEIFGMALHYYEEEDIDIGKDIAAHIVVNHVVELTEEEIQKAKEDAKEKIYQEERQRIVKTKVKKDDNKVTTSTNQINLF